MQDFIEIIKLGMGDYSLHHLAWHLLIVAFCIVTTGIFSVADTISGIYTAKKTGEKIALTPPAQDIRENGNILGVSDTRGYCWSHSLAYVMVQPALSVYYSCIGDMLH